MAWDSVKPCFPVKQNTCYSLFMNPYASYLGDRNAVEVISVTARQLNDLASRLGPAGLAKSTAPGKWTAREIFCHLADCEIAFGFRLRQALAEDNHVIQPFDQEKWAKTYAAYDAAAALAAFSSLRNWNVEFIRKVPKNSMSKPVTHPERGEMPFHVIVETMAGHDLNHLQQ